MGLLGDSLRARKMKDPVDGTAQVVGSTQPPDQATSSNVELNLVVQAEGIPATSVELTCMAPTRKWPWPGTTLPVTIDRADPTRVKVRWDDVPEAGAAAKQQADAMAASLNQGGQPAAGGADIGGLLKAVKDAYPDAEINVAGGGAPPQAAEGGGDDNVAQLERLAKLHESGALTDAEFESEKARILGSG